MVDCPDQGDLTLPFTTCSEKEYISFMNKFIQNNFHDYYAQYLNVLKVPIPAIKNSSYQNEWEIYILHY